MGEKRGRFRKHLGDELVRPGGSWHNKMTEKDGLVSGLGKMLHFMTELN